MTLQCAGWRASLGETGGCRQRYRGRCTGDGTGSDGSRLRWHGVWSSFWFVHCELLVSGLETTRALHSVRRGCDIAELDFWDFAACYRADALWRDTSVYDGIVVSDDVIVDDGGIVVNDGGFVSWQTVVVHMSVAKMVITDECEAIPAETETEPEADTAAVPCKADASRPSAPRRQWRPTAVHVRVSPRHPCWCPFISRNPNPADAMMSVPAPVMERCPTP